MKLEYYKAALGASWILIVGALGLMIGATSGPFLVLLTAVALLPSVLMLRFWHEPVETMSESIHQARR
jgi:glucose-6-phosphate-specific signal transduction histidine kinase